MKTENHAARVGRWALEEGFDRVGIARLEPSAHSEYFSEWLERGDHAEMSYLERRTEVRLDPRQVFDGARSVICVAQQYYPSADEDCSGDLWPSVARYARGEDYHRFMEQGLKRLAARIEGAFSGSRCKVYVDTGPLLERELAARAGLGSVGKNTNLLDPEIGSWFLLGEVFTTLDLEPGTPVGDLCGSCSKCLEACPTGALPQPFRLDSRRCISYWTIEHRGEIPPSVRPMLGRWVFGCDICQEVCPVNEQSQSEARRPEFRLPRHRASLDLAGLLRLDRHRYTQIFRGSPMKRAKLEGLQRNAAVAMGNSGSVVYEPPLIEALGEGEIGVRRHAAWALGQIGSERGREALRRALARESDPQVQKEIRAALQVSG